MITEHGVYKATSDLLPLFYISLCSVQKNISSPISFTASEYLFLYLIKGSGRLSLYNKTHHISSGEFVICRPFESKTFFPEAQDDSEFYAISFQGRYGTDLLSNLNLILKKNQFVGRDTEILSALDKILDETLKGDSTAKLIASSLFVSVLGELSRLAVSAQPKSTEKEFEKIAPALSSINSDCTSTISADDYAKMCNLSTSYFTHLFTKVTGFSPMEYKQLQRMSVAKNLLSTTTMTIKEISSIVGFKDPLYFGRCFKQATGQTPSGYRNKK